MCHHSIVTGLAVSDGAGVAGALATADWAADWAAEGEGVAVDTQRLIHHRHDDVLGHVLRLEQVDAGFDAHALAYGDKDFERRVTGAGAEPGCSGIDARGATFNGDD